ncbi:MAG: hypothetical protein Q8L56_17195 [Rhodocyclaceae bacterium]|nr:hypothetical protein [Rhodocyclaceae bacterium]
MENLLLSLGRLAGIGGVLICVVAAAIRLTGNHWIGGFEAVTLLQAGMAGMIFACLCFLVILTNDKIGRR